MLFPIILQINPLEIFQKAIDKLKKIFYNKFTISLLIETLLPKGVLEWNITKNMPTSIDIVIL